MELKLSFVVFLAASIVIYVTDASSHSHDGDNEKHHASSHHDDSHEDDDDDDDDDHEGGHTKAAVLGLGVFTAVMFILAIIGCIVVIRKYKTTNKRQINAVATIPVPKPGLDFASAYPNQASNDYTSSFKPDYLDVQALQAPPRYEEIAPKTPEAPHMSDMPPPYDKEALPPIYTTHA